MRLLRMRLHSARKSFSSTRHSRSFILETVRSISKCRLNMGYLNSSFSLDSWLSRVSAFIPSFLIAAWWSQEISRSVYWDTETNSTLLQTQNHSSTLQRIPTSTLSPFFLFKSNSPRYLEGVIFLAKEEPHVIQLLHLYNYFPTIEALEKTKSHGRQRLLGQKPMISECGVQCDTHFVESCLDKSYEWNEWQLRRRALMMVRFSSLVPRLLRSSGRSKEESDAFGTNDSYAFQAWQWNPTLRCKVLSSSLVMSI